MTGSAQSGNLKARLRRPRISLRFIRIYKCARRFYLLPGSEIIRLATSLFQMNSTSSAPMVAVMKPAP